MRVVYSWAKKAASSISSRSLRAETGNTPFPLIHLDRSRVRQILSVQAKLFYYIFPKVLAVLTGEKISGSA